VENKDTGINLKKDFLGRKNKVDHDSITKATLINRDSNFFTLKFFLSLSRY